MRGISMSISAISNLSLSNRSSAATPSATNTASACILASSCRRMVWLSGCPRSHEKAQPPAGRAVGRVRAPPPSHRGCGGRVKTALASATAGPVRQRKDRPRSAKDQFRPVRMRSEPAAPTAGPSRTESDTPRATAIHSTNRVEVPRTLQSSNLQQMSRPARPGPTPQPSVTGRRAPWAHTLRHEKLGRWNPVQHEPDRSLHPRRKVGPVRSQSEKTPPGHPAARPDQPPVPARQAHFLSSTKEGLVELAISRYHSAAAMKRPVDIKRGQWVEIGLRPSYADPPVQDGLRRQPILGSTRRKPRMTS